MRNFDFFSTLSKNKGNISPLVPIVDALGYFAHVPSAYPNDHL